MAINCEEILGNRLTAQRMICELKSKNWVFHFNKFLDTNNPSMRNVDNKGNGKKKKIIVEIVATTVMASLLMTPAMLTLVPKDFLLSLRQKKLFYKSEW